MVVAGADAAGHEGGDDLGVGGDLGPDGRGRADALRSAKLSTSPLRAAATNGPSVRVASQRVERVGVGLGDDADAGPPGVAEHHDVGRRRRRARGGAGRRRRWRPGARRCCRRARRSRPPPCRRTTELRRRARGPHPTGGTVVVGRGRPGGRRPRHRRGRGRGRGPAEQAGGVAAPDLEPVDGPQRLLDLGVRPRRPSSRCSRPTSAATPSAVPSRSRSMAQAASLQRTAAALRASVSASTTSASRAGVEVDDRRRPGWRRARGSRLAAAASVSRNRTPRGPWSSVGDRVEVVGGGRAGRRCVGVGDGGADQVDAAVEALEQRLGVEVDAFDRLAQDGDDSAHRCNSLAVSAANPPLERGSVDQPLSRRRWGPSPPPPPCDQASAMRRTARPASRPRPRPASAVGASTITRISGSVPEGRTSTRPVAAHAGLGWRRCRRRARRPGPGAARRGAR